MIDEEFDKTNGLNNIRHLYSNRVPDIVLGMILVIEKSKIPIYVKVDSIISKKGKYTGSIMKIGVNNDVDCGLKQGQRVTFLYENISHPVEVI